MFIADLPTLSAAQSNPFGGVVPSMLGTYQGLLQSQYMNPMMKQALMQQMAQTQQQQTKAQYASPMAQALVKNQQLANLWYGPQTQANINATNAQAGNINANTQQVSPNAAANRSLQISQAINNVLPHHVLTSFATLANNAASPLYDAFQNQMHILNNNGQYVPNPMTNNSQNNNSYGLPQDAQQMGNGIYYSKKANKWYKT